MKLNKKILVFVFPIIIIILFSACSSNNLQENFYNEIYNNWTVFDDADENSYINDLKERTSFEIEGIENEGDVYTVTLNVTSPDISNGIEEYQNSITDIPSDEEINENLKSIIESAELKTTEQTVTIFVTDDGSYDVEYSSGFADAMCGYSYQYYAEQMQKLYEGEE